MPRNPLSVPLTTADVIRETRLRNADMSPEARREAARTFAAWLTPAQRSAIAERNSARYDEAAHKVKISNAMMRAPGRAETRSYGVTPDACPRCGASARGEDWWSAHYNAEHPEVHRG